MVNRHLPRQAARGGARQEARGARREAGGARREAGGSGRGKRRDGHGCLCGEAFQGYGHNAHPVRDEGVACDACNGAIVLPQRFRKWAA